MIAVIFGCCCIKNNYVHCFNFLIHTIVAHLLNIFIKINAFGQVVCDYQLIKRGLRKSEF